MAGLGMKQSYIGDEAQSNRGMLSLNYPIQRGEVQNWDDWETLMNHLCYNELRLNMENHAFLYSAPINVPDRHSEKLTELSFESFGHDIPAIMIQVGSILDLYASGRTSGLSIHFGGQLLYATPVWEGYVNKMDSGKMRLGSDDLTNYLRFLLQESGTNEQTTSDIETVREIKEKLCYTALNYQEDLKTSKECSKLEEYYKLPDGNEILLNHHRFQAAEPIFNPSLASFYETPGIVEMVTNCVNNSTIDIRSDLLRNTIVSGGGSKMNEFPERLELELNKFYGQKLNPKINVVASPRKYLFKYTAMVLKESSLLEVRLANKKIRHYSTWIGGSILGSLSTCCGLYISRAEYLESGSTVVHRKTFV